MPCAAPASTTQAQLRPEDYKIQPLLCSQAYQTRAQLCSETGDKQGAIADYTQAIQTDPDFHSSFLAYFNRGELRFELREYQGAITVYTQVIRTKPDFATA